MSRVFEAVGNACTLASGTCREDLSGIQDKPRPVATEYWAQVTTDCYSDQPATDCRAGASRAAPVLQRTDSFAVEIYGLGAGVCRGLGVGLVLGVAVGVGLGAAPSTAAKISTRPQP